MHQFVRSYENAASESVNTDIRWGKEETICPCHFNQTPPAAYPYPFFIQTVVRWPCIQDTLLCDFIDHIIRHRPEIKSSQGVIGCVLCRFLMQGEVAAMQILPKLDAEMRCRLFYHSVFRLSYIKHRQPCKWKENNLSVTLT